MNLLTKKIFCGIFLLAWGITVADSKDSCKEISNIGMVVEIVCPDAKDKPISLAIKDLTYSLNSKLNFASFVTKQKSQISKPNQLTIFIGISGKDFTKLFTSAGLEKDFKPEKDGYRIKSFSWQNQPCLLIIGESKLVLSYAIFFLAEHLRLAPEIWKNIDIQRAPAFKYRLAHGARDSKNYLRLGYNMCLISNSPSEVVFFENFDQELMPEKSHARQRTERHRKIMEIQAETLKNLHLAPICGGDEFRFPVEFEKRPYFEDLMEKNGNDSFCFASKILWQAYREKYKEFVKDFPDVKGVLLRLGENYSYLSKDYIGSGVYKFNASRNAEKDYCHACRGISYEERIAKTINETADVLIPAGKLYIHRTWDTSNDLIHGNPNVFQNILSKIKNPEKIIWAIKYTKTDFWRYNFPNPCIGIGDVPQLIEFQCQREYEGKGAFPNFIGEEIALAYRYIKFKGCQGVWNWFHGGGWNGPKIKSDIWNQANIYAASRLMWDPNSNPKDIAKDWATLNFGKEAASAIAEMLLISDDAVLKWRYVAPYSRNHFGWTPGNLWTRDDIIRGETHLAAIYNEVHNKLDAVMAEKNQAVQDVERMKKLYESVKNKIISSQYLSQLSSSDVAVKPVSLKGLFTPKVPGTYKLALRYRYQDKGHHSEPVLVEQDLNGKLEVTPENLQPKKANRRLSIRKNSDSVELNADLIIPESITEKVPFKPELIVTNIENSHGNDLLIEPELLLISVTGKIQVIPLNIIDNSQNLSATVATSLEYELLLFKTCRDLWGAYFYFRRYVDRKDNADKRKALAFVNSWKENWTIYNKLLPTLPNVASLYKDDGMIATIHRIEASLKTGHSITRFDVEKTTGVGPFKTDSRGFILNWLICGPFPNPGGRPYYPTEVAMKNQKGYEEDFLINNLGEINVEPVPNISVETAFPETPENYWHISKDEKIKCEWLPRSSPDSTFSLRPEFSVQENIAAYAACYIEAPDSRKIKIKIGSDDGYKLWMNHKLIGQLCTFRGVVQDSEEYTVELEKGMNLVLIKIIQDTGGFGFCLRLTDLKDEPITDLEIWLKPKK
jgi:hypothetical protein